MSKNINLEFEALFPTHFDDFFTQDWFKWRINNYCQQNSTLPAVNIIENHEDILVELAAPGLSKNDFYLELDYQTLTISSRKDEGKVLRNMEWYARREFNYQSFSRSFYLPKSVVDVANIKAQYENGILKVIIPKCEEAKTLPPREIKIV